jgi:hypothetical protein
VTTPTVMVERDLIERVGGFDVQLQCCEGYDLWLRLARASMALGIPEALRGRIRRAGRSRTGPAFTHSGRSPRPVEAGRVGCAGCGVQLWALRL